MTHFKIFNTRKSGPDLQFNCVPYQNTWNLNQIIPRVSCISYHRYAEYLAMGSCSAATGCCSLCVSPGKDYSLTSAARKGVTLLSSTQPAPRSHEQPSRNRAGKPCSSFFFWSTNEIWALTTSQCFLLLFDLFTTFTVVSDFIVQLWVRNMFSGSYSSIPSSTHTFLKPCWSLVTAGENLKHRGPQEPLKPSAVSKQNPFLRAHFLSILIFGNSGHSIQYPAADRFSCSSCSQAAGPWESDVKVAGSRKLPS